jgi:hypothetical protein
MQYDIGIKIFGGISKGLNIVKYKINCDGLWCKYFCNFCDFNLSSRFSL